MTEIFSTCYETGTSHWVIEPILLPHPRIYRENRRTITRSLFPAVVDDAINYFTATALSPAIYMRARAEAADKSTNCLKLYELVAMLATFSPDLSDGIVLRIG